MHLSIALLALAVGHTIAKTITIDVGKSGLSFSPDSTTADVGDVIEFHFFGSFHTAVQGNFSTPCARGSLAGSGFNSGPIKNQPDGSGSVFQVTVQDTKPIWFYCSTPSHCQSGMAGVINPPSSGNTLDVYKSNAATTDTSEGSSTVQGGVVAPVPSPGSSSAATASTSAPESSAAASSAESSASAIESSAEASSTLAATASSTEAPSPSSAQSTPGSTGAPLSSSSIRASGTSRPTSTPTFLTTSSASNLKATVAKTILGGLVVSVGLLVFVV